MNNTCNITIKPCLADNEIEKFQITYDLNHIERAAGEELCRADLSTASIPGSVPENVHVSDAGGELILTTKDARPYPYVQRYYLSSRPVNGPVCITYEVRPRVLTEDAVCGPYFDLRREECGVNSAGFSFLMAIQNYQGIISLIWDLSELPSGHKAVCTWGEGNLTMEAELEKFRQCYYAVGDVKSVTESDFGFYWLSPTDFDIHTIADYTKNLFAIMQNFFRDTNPVYRIFIRKDPFTHSGGTALLRSYLLGWNETEEVTVASLQNILAHEMVHNWPQLHDDPFGTSSWYSEGTAEYYSIMIPLRAGLISKETALSEIQTRTDAYYTNPTRHMENLEAARICWEDRRAQRLPYGRGMFFLANTDIRIRKATANAFSLDDVVLAILEKDRRDESLSNELFLETVRKISGIDVTEDYEIMRTGRHFAPLAGTFDGHFAIAEKKMPEADTGKTVISYQWTVI